MNIVKTILFASALIFLPGLSLGGDLDDGIELDESLDDSNALQKGINVPFILMKAKGKELTGKRTGNKMITSRDSSAGQGNIIFGPGAKIAPGTVIINRSDNRGATAIANGR
ncbi:MAG: hypothetical protein N3A55_07370 [Methylohalobius sp.]|nr:hypothetical protein [Methylohalobius sp.]